MRIARHIDNSLTTRFSPQERGQRRKLARAIRVQKESRSRIMQAVRQKLPPALARADFEMVALDHFRRLGHDNHHRLFQIYGWEEKKTKTSWCGTSVDHKHLAESQIQAMTTADLNRFLVTCAVVLDLYCPESCEPHESGCPLQSRCIEDRRQSDCRVLEAEGGKGQRSSLWRGRFSDRPGHARQSSYALTRPRHREP